PDMVGDTLRTAQREAEAAGLDVNVTREEFSSTVPPNRVISQRLRPGSEVDEGSSIGVVLSRGPELEPVPEVTGLSEDAATRQLKDLGFEVRVLRDYNETVPAGRVFEQSPDPDTSFEIGKQVRITVSRGKAPVQVPEVTGLSQAEASAILAGEGLGVEVTEEFSGEIPRGRVIRQSPGANETVPAESTVSLVVSKGPRTFAMPNVEEQTQESATATLQGLGLRVRIVDVPETQGNLVIDQDPEAGTTVQTGQEVTLFIGG
ncbi:MAG: PASTA domain-containing protein, partial [Actinomycetota bacterium]